MKVLIILSVIGVAFANTPTCGENDRYAECGTACPLTCENYRNPPRFCSVLCKTGCECEQGYVRAPNGRCIKSFACPKNARMKLKQSSLGVCDLPAETGVCKSHFPRYYFDIKTSECKQFIYGGCGGNENNFESAEECKNFCVVHATNDVCELPAETGLCEAYMPRFFFNKRTGKCERFVYGGCGGNGNNFRTEGECQNSCGPVEGRSNPVCDLEKVVGPCKASRPRYFYNKATGNCERFIYGGCRGNGNNFMTRDQCNATCKA